MRLLWSHVPFNFILSCNDYSIHQIYSSEALKKRCFNDFSGDFKGHKEIALTAMAVCIVRRMLVSDKFAPSVIFLPTIISHTTCSRFLKNCSDPSSLTSFAVSQITPCASGYMMLILLHDMRASLVIGWA